MLKEERNNKKKNIDKIFEGIIDSELDFHGYGTAKIVI